MQRCQDQLEFQIETPSDEEIAKRFAEHQRELSVDAFSPNPAPKNRRPKIRSRKSKQQKRQERINRDKVMHHEE